MGESPETARVFFFKTSGPRTVPPSTRRRMWVLGRDVQCERRARVTTHDCDLGVTAGGWRTLLHMMLCVPSATRALNELFGLESAAASYDPCVDDLTTVMSGLGVAEREYVPSHRCDEVEVADRTVSMQPSVTKMCSLNTADSGGGCGTVPQERSAGSPRSFWF